MRGFSFLYGPICNGSGFTKFRVDKSVYPMSVRIEKINTWDGLLHKKDFYLNGLVNSSLLRNLALGIGQKLM